MSKSRPIIFSGAMVRSLLEGRKTQTRRLTKIGDPGDVLWVRETCRAHELTDKEAEEDTFGVMERLGLEYPMYGLDGVIYAADGAFREIQNTRQASEAWAELNHYRGKQGATVPPIHMPRWASRLSLRITEARAEQLQDISEADAIAEGARSFEYLPRTRPFQSDAWSMESPTTRDTCLGSARMAFANFLCKLHNGPNWNLKTSNIWDENPMVWATTFESIS